MCAICILKQNDLGYNQQISCSNVLKVEKNLRTQALKLPSRHINGQNHFLKTIWQYLTRVIKQSISFDAPVSFTL